MASTACNTDVDLSSPATLPGEASDSAAFNDIGSYASRESSLHLMIDTLTRENQNLLEDRNQHAGQLSSLQSTIASLKSGLDAEIHHAVQTRLEKHLLTSSSSASSVACQTDCDQDCDFGPPAASSTDQPLHDPCTSPPLVVSHCIVYVPMAAQPDPPNFAIKFVYLHMAA